VSKTQIEKTAQHGGSIFFALLGFAKHQSKLWQPQGTPLKIIFGNGYRVDEVKLFKLVQATSPKQKKAVENFLVSKHHLSSELFSCSLTRLTRAVPHF